PRYGHPGGETSLSCDRAYDGRNCERSKKGMAKQSIESEQAEDSTIEAWEKGTQASAFRRHQDHAPGRTFNSNRGRPPCRPRPRYPSRICCAKPCNSI